MLNEMAVLRNRPKVKPWKGLEKHPVRSYQVKEDGMYISVLKDESGIRVYGRKPQHDLWEKVCKVSTIIEPLKNVPLGTVIEGELISSTGRATDVRSFKTEDLFFIAFAIPVFRYIDYQVTAHPDIAVGMLRTYCFSTPRKLELSEDKRIITIDRLERFSKDLKVEGIVCKNFHYDEWYKVKPIKTADCEVYGFTWGTKRLTGKIGSLLLRVLDKETGEYINVGNVGIGFTDYERSLPFEEYQGKIIEVAYDKLEAKKGLRFPRFNGFRTDKDTPNYIQELV